MLALCIGLVIVLLDQLTKIYVRQTFVYGGDPVSAIPGLFDIVYVRNPGAAWGIFGGQQIVLIVLSIGFLLFLSIYRQRFLKPTLDHKIAFGLMIGGILGNLIDRIKLGWVTDFLDFHLGSYHWPSFNVADAAICVAVGIYILSSLWHKNHPLKEQGAKSAERKNG